MVSRLHPLLFLDLFLNGIGFTESQYEPRKESVTMLLLLHLCVSLLLWARLAIAPDPPNLDASLARTIQTTEYQYDAIRAKTCKECLEGFDVRGIFRGIADADLNSLMVSPVRRTPLLPFSLPPPTHNRFKKFTDNTDTQGHFGILGQSGPRAKCISETR